MWLNRQGPKNWKQTKKYNLNDKPILFLSDSKF